MTVDVQAIQAKIKTDQAQAAKPVTALERAVQQKAAEVQQPEQPVAQTDPEVRVFYGEFQTHQNYLTAKGNPVSFYRGYFATSKQELIDFCLGLDGVQEVTGKVKASEIPVAPKRDRNRNWASAGPSDPTMISPAELLQRVVQNSSNMTTSARSDSSN